MQTTQWREKLNPIRYSKSAHSTTSKTAITHTNTTTTTSTISNTKTNKDTDTVLNVNGKQMFQTSSRSIWDYNPDELKVILFEFVRN